MEGINLEKEENTNKNIGNMARKANSLFLLIVLISVCANMFASIVRVKGIAIPIVPNLLISQMVIVVPGLIYYVCISKTHMPFTMYKKIRPVSILLLVVFTWLIEPLISAINLFSQLFTSNEVLKISSEVLELPIVPMIFIMGILGPFCEEFVFRGLIYNSLKCGTGRYLASGIVSALFFGLMHMNFNQFCYAFVLGVVFAAINEMLDSTWPSFVCHAVVNTQNVLLLYTVSFMTEKLSGDGIGKFDIASAANTVTSGNKIFLVVMFVGLFMVSVVTTSIAGLLLYGICSLEGKTDSFKLFFKFKNNKKMHDEEDTAEKSQRKKVLYFTGSLAMSFCIFVIFFLEPIINIIKK